MLEKIEGVEIAYEGNCFEKEKGILEKIEKLYKFMEKEKMIESEQDFKFISSALRIMEKRILFEKLRTDYTGTAHIIFSDREWHGINDTVYYYKTAYGSCSYCDVWTECNFIETMYDESRSAIKFPNKYEMVKYLLCSDSWIWDSDVVEWAEKEAKDIIKWANEYHKENEKVQNQVRQIKLCLKARKKENAKD